jgi:nucleotide-binding universal stress UspA family protein
MQTPKLLIPLDGSEFSRKILPHVRDVFAPFSYDINLLQVTKPPPGIVRESRQFTISGENIRAPSQLEQEQYISAFLTEKMQPDAHYLQRAGFNVSRAVRFGNPAKKILEFVTLEGIAMVAMATHGRSGLPRLLMGSVAETLVRRLSVPILLVHPIEVAERDNQTVTTLTAETL